MTEMEFVSDVSHSFGMNYSLNDESHIMKHIITMGYDIDMVAKYADGICINNHENVEFLKYQLDLKEWTTEKLIRMKSRINNPTSLGNVAYLALHSPAPYNQFATEIYNAIINVLHNDGQTREERYDRYLLDNPPIRFRNIRNEGFINTYPYVAYTPVVLFCVALIVIKIFYMNN